MKKIICTVTNDLTYDQRMIRICTSLAGAGFEVVLVGRKLKTSRPLTEEPFTQKRLSLWFGKGKLFYLEHNIRLFFFLLFSKFDIVNSVDLDTLVAGYLVSRMRNKTCVYDAHEYFSEVPEVVERPLVKKIWETIAALILPRLTYCYTVGPSLAAIFEKKYETKFEVIRNVPKSRTLPGSANPKILTTPYIILYQGVLNVGRGLEEAFEAMKYLSETELWIAGEGDLSYYLRKKAKDFDVEAKVKFLGRLSPDELFLVTQQAHLGLNLLNNKGLNYYYSLANKAFDYLQAGIPSLHPDFPEYRNINNQQQVFLLLDDMEPATIAKAIDHLLKNEELYYQMSENCREAARFFTWENEEKKLIQLYRQIG